jgi:hypothetical protein
MPQPLPDAVVATLKTDACAALAAIMIISNAHSELMAWAQRSLSPLNAGEETIDRDIAEACQDQLVPAPTLPANPRDRSPGARKANGAGGGNGAKRHGAKKVSRAKGSHNPREAAARHDQALLVLMRANPDASVTELIEMNNRPRNSTMLSLERLEKAGLVEHASRGKWIAVDPDFPRDQSPGALTPRPAGWLEPLSGAHVAKHTAAMLVPDRLTASTQ